MHISSLVKTSCILVHVEDCYSKCQIQSKPGSSALLGLCLLGCQTFWLACPLWNLVQASTGVHFDPVTRWLRHYEGINLPFWTNFLMFTVEMDWCYIFQLLNARCSIQCSVTITTVIMFDYSMSQFLRWTMAPSFSKSLALSVCICPQIRAMVPNLSG